MVNVVKHANSEMSVDTVPYLMTQVETADKHKTHGSSLSGRSVENPNTEMNS